MHYAIQWPEGRAASVIDANGERKATFFKWHRRKERDKFCGGGGDSESSLDWREMVRRTDIELNRDIRRHRVKCGVTLGKPTVEDVGFEELNREDLLHAIMEWHEAI